MTEFLINYLLVVGAICGLAAAGIAVEHIRMRRYQRRLAENMARRLRE